MTVLGHHTAAELVDLLAAKDHAHQALGNSFEAFRAKWAQIDPKTFTAFSDDYQANAHAYQQVRASVVSKIQAAGHSPVALNMYPVEDEWIALLRADQRVENILSDGDFDDLARRIDVAAHAANVTLPAWGPTPQPRASSDVEGTVYRETEPGKLRDEARAAVRATGKTFGTIIGDLLGGAADGVGKGLSPMQMVGGAAVVGVAAWAAIRVATKPVR